jgi:hypothetical protein
MFTIWDISCKGMARLSSTMRKAKTLAVDGHGQADGPLSDVLTGHPIALLGAQVGGILLSVVDLTTIGQHINMKELSIAFERWRQLH